MLVTALSGLVTPQAEAAIPPQQPGVALRVFDLQTDLGKLCVLKPGQTPNVDGSGTKTDNARVSVTWNPRFRNVRLEPIG